MRRRGDLCCFCAYYRIGAGNLTFSKGWMLGVDWTIRSPNPIVDRKIDRIFQPKESVKRQRLIVSLLVACSW